MSNRRISATTDSQSALNYAVLLSDALRPLECAEEVKSAASNLLGQYLAADRALYFEVQGANYVVERSYVRDVAPMNGHYPVESFGTAVLETLRAGKTAVEVDCWQNPDIPSELRPAYDAARIRAYIGVPLVKAGTFVGGLVVHQAQPRNWTRAEIALIEGTAESTWAAVERARATRQLHASERLRRVALEAADLGVWSIDPIDRTLTTDERFRIIFQGTADALSYDGAVNAVHPEDTARILDAITSAMRLVDPLPYAQEYRVLWPDGSLHWVFATGRGHVVNGADGLYLESFDGTIQDITERKKAEDAKAQAEQRERNAYGLLRAVSDGSCDTIAAIDTNFRFTFVNTTFQENFLKLFGVPALVGNRLDETLAHLPEDKAHAVRVWSRALNGERFVVNGKFGDPARSRRLWHIFSYPLLDTDGSIVGAAQNAVDVTDQMLAVEERERLLGRLQEQDQRKDEFLAMLSHELRNPLVPISNAVQLLRLQDSQDAKQLQAVSILERQLSQLQRLVDDLLEVSRITTGQMNLRLDCTALDSIVKGAVETTQPLMAQRHHQLVVSLPSQPIWLDVDAFRMEQVLVNLLLNAAKYSDDGCHISVTATQEGPEAVLRVHDTGAGIDPALLPHIFDLFTQAKRSLARSEGGLGLGLALVKRLVELHGGRVEAFSTPGIGSEFVVRLPAAMPQMPVPVSVSPDGSGTNSRKLANIERRVLVVDDNIDAAESLADLLNLYGYEARVAHDGLSALAVATEWQPEVMLLDIGLPQMDGYDLARRIKAQPDMKQVVLIALTGYGQATDIRQAMAAGFDHHLTKPAEFSKIQELLEGC